MAPRSRTLLHVLPLEDRTTPAQFAPNQVLVGFQPGAEQSGLAAVRSSPGVVSTTSLGFGLYKVNYPAGTPVPTAVAALSVVPGVRFAEPDYIVQPTAVPNDPRFTDGTQWGHLNTGQNGGTAGADTRAVAGWDVSYGTGDTIVAVIDGGIDHTHPDLAANVWTNPGEVANDGIDNDANGFVDDIHGWDFTRNTGDIIPGINLDHGMHVAGIIGAVGNNGIGVAGMAWKTRMMSLPLFSNGATSGQTSVAIQGLNYALMMGSKLSNNSWGGGGMSMALQTAIGVAGTQGHVFVAAAGNSSTDNDTGSFFPTNFFGILPNVVSVAAFDRNDQLASFSNYGRQKVLLGAPGVEIFSTIQSGGYGPLDGTSMASPQVAGALAVFMDSTPGATPTQIIAALSQSVRRIPAAANKTVTGGVLDLNALMQLSGASVFATGAGEGGGPHVKVYRGNGSLVHQFMAYNTNFTGGVRVATGDVTGDRYADIITVAGPGGGPHVKVFDGRTFQEVYSFFAFEGAFRGGLTVATGDINGDGRADIIIGAEAGGGPRVRVFSKLTPTGGLTSIADFFAYDITFTGGVRVAAGVFTPGSKQADLITTPGAGGGPHLRRFSAASVAAGKPAIASQTMVGDPNDRSGLWVAAGDLNLDGVADIAVGASSGTPIVRVVDGRTLAIIGTVRNPFTGELPGLTNPGSATQVGSSYTPPLNNGLLPPGASPDSLPYQGSQRKPIETSGYIFGVRVAVQDVNGDKKPDLILAGGPNDAPSIALFDGQSLAAFGVYMAYDPSFYGGVYVGGTGV